MENLLISACLLGENVKYNGGNNKLDEKTLSDIKKKYNLIPFCPEVEGGLPTPRTPAEILEGKVIDKKGKDVTKEFELGAEKALEICKKYDIKKAILKDGSPSCSSSYTYDGTFQKIKIPKEGITSKLLKENKISVINEKLPI